MQPVKVAACNAMQVILILCALDPGIPKALTLGNPAIHYRPASVRVEWLVAC